ncbi:MAG: oligosaccharide flippase family protein [Eubacteriales bacterium]|nr:oligosaccharide flippase family protein [Eubacteriales bacterium]
MTKKKENLNLIVIINVMSTVLVQGLSFFTSILFMRMLGTAQYGLFSISNAWMGVIACFMGLGVNNALIIGKIQFKEDYLRYRSCILLFGFLSCVVIFFSICVFLFPLSVIMKISPMMVVLISFGASSQFIISMVNQSNTFEKKALENFIIAISLAVSSVLLSYFLILNMDPESKYVARMIGLVVPNIIISFVMGLKMYLEKPALLKKEYCEFAFKYGIPIVFHLLIGIVLTQSDRIMMQRFGITDSEIGIYSFFYTVSSILNFILQALNNSWCPFYCEDLIKKDYEKIKEKTKNYVEVFSILTFGFLLLVREVSYLMGGKEYQSGIGLIPVLVLSVFFTFMYQFPVNYEFFHKKTYFITIATFISGIINIVLNWFLIPQYRMEGAAIATTISYGILFLIHYIIVIKLIDRDFHLDLKVFVPGLFTFVLGWIIFVKLRNLWLIRWGSGLVIGIIELSRIRKRKTIF